MNSIKFSFNYFISLFFIILGIGILVLSVRVAVKSFQQSLIVDESKASLQGLSLDKNALTEAIRKINSASIENKMASNSGEIKETGNTEERESSKSAEINLAEGEEELMKVEIIYAEENEEFINEIKTFFPVGTEFKIELAKEGLDESKVIYKNEYIKLKNSLVSFLQEKNFEIKVFKRQEDKEFDLTIELKNISE